MYNYLYRYPSSLNKNVRFTPFRQRSLSNCSVFNDKINNSLLSNNENSFGPDIFTEDKKKIKIIN